MNLITPFDRFLANRGVEKVQLAPVYKHSRRHCLRSKRPVVRSAHELTDRQRPAWADGGVVSSFVDILISTPPLYALMKVLAKQVIRGTAERKGVAWGKSVQQLESQRQQLEELKVKVEDGSIVYPPYYLQPFHAYTHGNLEWLAAYEVEPATYSMAWRAFKDDALTPQEAHNRLRASVMSAVKEFQHANGGRPVTSILDVGCAVGMSTRALADEWPQASVTGLDLSPYLLAVAQLKDSEADCSGRITYVHALAETTPFPDASFDLISFQFVVHECPKAATVALIREAKRLLRPGGVIFLVDNHPRSKVIQNLPPAIFTLMKSTEPHSDEYYALQLDQLLREEGFKHADSAMVDARHGCFMGMA